MHGLGNSYIYVDGFKESIPNEERLPNLASEVANPYTGIGSDGLILILPSNVADVKMRVFNSDGSEAKSCGNGLRCVSKYVYDHRYIEDDKFSIETLGGIVESVVHPSENGDVSEVTVDMGAPRLKRKDVPMRGKDGALEENVIDATEHIDGADHTFTALSMGNPHAVFFVDTLEDAPLETVGPLVEKADIFPEGTNVEFISIENPSEIDFAVWERGSGVTQACGTGACAAVVAAVLNGKLKRDEPIVVHLPGGDLTIRWSSKDNHVWMKGPAVTVCTGTYMRNG
ncbi:diaminopimelate epimerase [Salicibibacter halophilus]|uniref:Diaminopimelate epimerase n=1 Tax=Salicibibacter halophilus TaxID=2502791 RepID=A0A514LMK8_9BACI|nr:diaminopimelate epimerase [Salicibibacter halophilus]QDI93076.1 diaminopimelate epimerase [Salicibibacter halophilus]